MEDLITTSTLARVTKVPYNVLSKMIANGYLTPAKRSPSVGKGHQHLWDHNHVRLVRQYREAKEAADKARAALRVYRYNSPEPDRNKPTELVK